MTENTNTISAGFTWGGSFGAIANVFGFDIEPDGASLSLSVTFTNDVDPNDNWAVRTIDSLLPDEYGLLISVEGTGGPSVGLKAVSRFGSYSTDFTTLSTQQTTIVGGHGLWAAGGGVVLDENGELIGVVVSAGPGYEVGVGQTVWSIGASYDFEDFEGTRIWDSRVVGDPIAHNLDYVSSFRAFDASVLRGILCRNPRPLPMA